MSTVSSNRAKIFFGPKLTKRRFLPKSPLRLALLVFGTVLIVLVILVMMGWQSALLVGATLPLSSLMVLSGMRLFGIPIQQMWVTGLTLTTHENKAVS